MEKRGTLMMTVLVVMAMLFASCSSHLSEGDTEGGSSAKTVKASLSVELAEDSQKAINVDDALTGLTFWYKATPQWSQTRPIAGDTKGAFLQIPGYSTGDRDLGYFTTGLWRFDVQVRKGSTVIYSGNTNFSIYDTHVAITVTVAPETGGNPGTVTITVSVPTTGPQPAHQPAEPGDGVYHESMAISYSGYVNGSPVSGNFTIDDTARGAAPNALTTYTTEPLDLAPGAYTVTMLYTDEHGTQSAGVSVAVNVLADQTAAITGQIENGIWHASNLTIKKPGFSSFSVAAATADTYITPTGDMLYTCTATSSSGNTISYQWYVNGVKQTGKTASTFTFNSSHDAAFGLYEITCVAYDGTLAVASNNTDPDPSTGNSLWIAVANSITCNASTGSGSGTVECARTHATPNEIIMLTVTPSSGTLTALKVNSVDAMAGYDAGSGKAYVHMPANGNASIDSVFTAAP